MQTAAPDLFDLSGEPDHVKKMYGLNRSEPKIKGGRGGGAGVYSAYAKNCLLARRMVERGVRFVKIIHASWDLKARGLLDSTLVVWAGEFGRTPLGENRRGRKANTGRAHHPFAFSIFLAGGGIKGGQVYGQTDEIGWGIEEKAVHVNDFHATLLRLFGRNHERLTDRFQGRDFRLTDVAGRVLDPWIA